MKISKLTKEETKEKYPTLEKLYKAINAREIRDKNEIPKDVYFEDYREIETETETDEEIEVFYTDFTMLPNYTDEDDCSKEPIWSWDKDYFLIGDELPFSLVTRG